MDSLGSGGHAVQLYDCPPTDADLQSLVTPEGWPPYLSLEDDGTILKARPRPWPAVLYWACMSLPALGWGVAIVWNWDDLFVSPVLIQQVMFGIVTVGLVVFTIFGWFVFQWHNHHTIRQEDLFILDRAAGKLQLLRNGVVLSRGEVVEVIEVHGWHRVHDPEELSATYLREVSVVTHWPVNRYARHAVVIAGHLKPVTAVATALAQSFEVPNRKLVQSLLGGSWRRVSD